MCVQDGEALPVGSRKNVYAKYVLVVLINRPLASNAFMGPNHSNLPHQMRPLGV